MTDATKNSIAVSYGDRKTGTRYSRDGTAVLQRTDCLAGQEYLPMDIFVDTKTMRLHFQGSSLLGRLA